MRALSIRQPYAELILRGMKTIEYRSRATRIVGERFYIYASKGGAWGQKTGVRRAGSGSGRETPVRSDDLSVGDVPPWMIELANALRLFPHDLPTGVIVGSAVIEKVVEVACGQWSVSRGDGEVNRGDGEVSRGDGEVSSGDGEVSSGDGEVASGQLPVAGGGHLRSLATGDSPLATMFEWHLTGVERAKRARKPKGHPQPVWFKPF